MAPRFIRGRGAFLPVLVAGGLVAWALGARATDGITAGRGAGGLSSGPAQVEALRRIGRETRARVEKVDRAELDQLFVVPQRPGRNNVRYYAFDWRRFDYLERDGLGGVRFYFYTRELEPARIAAAMVREQYERLSARFQYRPTARVPYLLYNSHREFENTNVFFVNESVLGVTSPRDLRMALPFWGERGRFREVSTHEMAHQFTIQKVADRAASAGVDGTISAFPLWFIEGLAEYYAKDGIDAETELFARDLLVNPRPEKGYALPPFWEDGPASYLSTYKLGQLRVAFLEAQYGDRVLQAILDQSPRMARSAPGVAMVEGRESFQDLVSRLAREKPDTVAQRFQAWLKRRYFPAYLSASQEPPALPMVELAGEPDAFTTGPEPNLVLYRAVERETGRSRLELVDRRDPTSRVEVAADGRPGVESLHPVLRSVAALGRDRLAYVARHGPADALYVVDYSVREEDRHRRIALGEARRIELAGADLIEAGDPAFSPDGTRVAFFGLDQAGRIDVWAAEVATGRLVRITNDGYAERDLAWSDEPPTAYGLEPGEGGGGQGTLLLASDRTSHGRFNLFALDPATGRTRPLTDEPFEQRGPTPIGHARVVFSTAAKGRPDLHLLDAPTGRVSRITDFVTGLVSPASGVNGLMALGFFGGQYRVFDVPTRALVDRDVREAFSNGAPSPPPADVVEPIPAEAPVYEPFTLENWRLETGVAAIGTYSVGQGALLFGDVLGDRNVLLQLAVYGSPRLTDASAFYFDKAGRKVAGAGLFHTFTQRRDTLAPGFARDVFYLQREFGVTGLWSWPFDTFTRVEARAVAQGVKREFQYPIDAAGLIDTAIDLGKLRGWQAAHGGYDLEGLGSARFGYDTTRYRYPGGPYGGGSVLIEAGAGWLPTRGETHRFATFDAQLHHRPLDLVNVHLRLAAGASGGSVFGRQFFLSSFDNLRGYSVSDQRLIGRAYAVANADLAIPLDALVRLAIVTSVEGIVGVDFGSVASDVSALWSGRVLGWVLGLNLGLGPFALRVHFARNVDIGAPIPNAGWVPNISLRYAYF